ncbi:restriction endonuclease subunit S [Salinibacter ruber]|uniref:Type I restriction enzyme S subunit n=1 Tax=Salinibacter ruber TaxID=146919 RepID=A0A9X2TGL6_9BACT|nr:restriction endonuclease subunit S [Salinibacter ruber]MCS3662010.1 type I restriction enzyme S subunit [Salinibacter ruber]MCS3711805.1 type I restriction enzyme S subunit [Salinibacter ruber]MCS4142648.1 type I restriction enzyme S subunit [Salinibacter ruber]
MDEYRIEDLPPGGVSGFSADTFRWPLMRIGDLVDLHYGKALVEDDRDPGTVPVYGSNGVTGSHSEPLEDGPTVVLGRKGQGHLGVKWCDRSFWVIDTAYYTSFNRDRINPKYFYYFTDQMGLNHLKVGTSNPSLQRDVFCDQPIPLPPLPVQRRIADILGALDDKIELNRRMNETLEAMAQALYRHWFVDFGPFQDREFVDTAELGPIPKGWEVTTVGNTTHINLGQSPKSKYYNEEGDGLVFHQGVSTYGWRFPVHERYCSKKKRVADEGDILISVRAPVGRLNIADRKLIIGRGLTALRREDGNQSFLFYFLKEFFDEENKIGSGTVFNSITKSVLNDLEMIGPPPEVVEEFESIVRPMDKQIRNNHEENKTLAETRDYLLPKLISGEIEVDAAEKAVETNV